jgi:hypothetical protein
MNPQSLDEEHYFGGIEQEGPSRKRKRKLDDEMEPEKDPINFEDPDDEEPARNKYLTEQHETQNKISGCLFGYVGIIVLGVSIYLIK